MPAKPLANEDIERMVKAVRERPKLVGFDDVFNGLLQETASSDQHGVISIRSHAYWMRRDGSFIAVRDMSIDHLRRCIGAIFKSKTGWRASYMPHLIEELKRRETDGHDDGGARSAPGGPEDQPV